MGVLEAFTGLKTEFVRTLLTDPYWVYLLETSNFCVPSAEMFYMGPSAFWGLQDIVLVQEDAMSVRSAPGSVVMSRKKFAANAV